jgi:Septum formation initiator.
MKKQGRRKKRIFGNGVAIMGLVLVVALLAIVIFVRGNTLEKQNKNYLAMEESLEEELSIEKQREKKLDDRRVYSKTKEYVMEEAREIFGLQMPNEIIVKPEN